MTEKPRYSPSVEDYLKAIYTLSDRGEAAATSDIAQVLDVQPASVSGMLRRLADSGLAEHARYKGVHLTPRGRQEALRIVRRHRILETYLHVRLGYSWEEVHREAEHLEHAASDLLIERMAEALSYPKHDPHGAPIPTRGGEIEATDYPTLAEESVVGRVRVRAVQDDDAERLRYMEARGLMPGVLLAIEERAPFKGPVTVRVGGDDGEAQTVGFDLARRIYVEPGP